MMLSSLVPVDPVYALPSVWPKLASIPLAYPNYFPLEVILWLHKGVSMPHLESTFLHRRYQNNNGR